MTLPKVEWLFPSAQTSTLSSPTRTLLDGSLPQWTAIAGVLETVNFTRRNLLPFVCRPQRPRRPRMGADILVKREPTSEQWGQGGIFFERNGTNLTQNSQCVVAVSPPVAYRIPMTIAAYGSGCTLRLSRTKLRSGIPCPLYDVRYVNTRPLGGSSFVRVHAELRNRRSSARASVEGFPI